MRARIFHVKYAALSAANKAAKYITASRSASALRWCARAIKKQSIASTASHMASLILSFASILVAIFGLPWWVYSANLAALIAAVIWLVLSWRKDAQRRKRGTEAD